ncbi:histamine N-methyltransferase-like [Anneissia japonica]|uniref:histamine N-methyltransferase-like n=1 Tax=Anneissia japonica TaxID=1529436 RepID=UPI0014257310|nr:histamine N-methyltransferase-like [Anneissia japonica]
MSIFDSAYYLEAYAQFVAGYDKSGTMKVLSESEFVKHVVEQLKTKDTSIRMLGIGSSSGEIEILFIKQLLNRFSTIENTVVEPSTKAITEYQSTVKGKWNNVKFSWFNSTFQQFREQLESAGNDQKFHHINLVDSIYYVDNLKEDILFMFDKLEKGGIMLIVVQSDQCLMHKIKQRYPELSPESKLVSSTEVIDACKTNRIPFHHHRQEGYADISRLYSHSFTRNEHMLVDFLVEITNFKENVSEGFYDEVIAFIKSQVCSETTEGKMMVHADIDLMFITKQV